MLTKIIATLLISFYSSLSFSQTKKLLHRFERHVESIPRNNIQCFPYNYIENKEDYTINLFSDSTFVISYSRTGNLYPEQYEILSGKLASKKGSIYLIRDSTIARLAKGSPDDLGRLEQVFNIDSPLRIEYSDEIISFYNPAGPFLVLSKANPLNKYRNFKPAPVFLTIPAFSPQFSNNPISF